MISKFPTTAPAAKSGGAREREREREKGHRRRGMAEEGEDKNAGGSGGGGGGVEEGVGNGGERERLKLFVGQVPKNMTEEQLLAMFKEVSIVDEVNIIRDKVTKASRGCCFLICPSRQEADKVVNACHNKRTLPGVSSPLQVKYADGELERLERKLFIGMLPKNVTDVEITTLFSKYGNIKDLQILRGSPQTSKGCAFLRYETKEQTLAALEALNGKHKIEGSNIPLVVKWADTEKERQARRGQKSQYQPCGVSHNNSIQQPSLFGTLPMGYFPPYNGYGYQGGTFGVPQYPLASMQNHAGYHNMISSIHQGNMLHGISHDLSARTAPTNVETMQAAGYPGSGYRGIPALQYPLGYHGSMMSPRPLGDSHSPVQAFNPSMMSPRLLGDSHNSVQAYTANNGVPLPSSTSTSSGGHIEGPPGANLFIYHIPQEYGDQELSNAFEGFGRVLSAKVFLDKATGFSKCFGFVSYDSPEAAQAAIDVMNGFQLCGKKLKVQVKRDNKHQKPY